MSTSGNTGSGPFASYKNVLKALSARTGTPLSSLVLSFGIVHEVTALVPLVGVFYGARAFGVGERIVQSMIAESDEAQTHWTRQKFRKWVEDGEEWAERVGRRYGFFGFEKGSKPDSKSGSIYVPGRIAGDVANAVVAYGTTKMTLPLRIGLSLYLAPRFSRGVVEPMRRGFVGLFKRG